MIIFDLDGILADCEHRRHFVDPSKKSPNGHFMNQQSYHDEKIYFKRDPITFEVTNELWKPDWKAFYETCDQDKPIEPVIEILDGIYQNTVNFWKDVQIWSGRCESVREKTIKWLEENILWDKLGSQITLKMRPIGDCTPDDELKERWLDEYIESMYPKLEPPSENEQKNIYYRKNPIEFVFDDRPKVIRMWQRRGIFVFNCNQTGKEF